MTPKIWYEELRHLQVWPWRSVPGLSDAPSAILHKSNWSWFLWSWRQALTLDILVWTLFKNRPRLGRVEGRTSKYRLFGGWKLEVGVSGRSPDEAKRNCPLEAFNGQQDVRHRLGGCLRCLGLLLALSLFGFKLTVLKPSSSFNFLALFSISCLIANSVRRFATHFKPPACWRPPQGGWP